MRALRRQIYNYSKGHVAYQLTTLIRDRDLRGLMQLMTHLPVWHLRRLKARLLGKSSYPVSLILLEVVGNLAGPWSLWQSRRRVQREGLSEPYIPVPRSD
ncbi:MAG: hypothetical protein E6J80_12270 [Deltaproteobacteria bacterium]|nr:MAG: hypothetical protein E6J80_12270 [Deltaproteobacteria bacterium]